MFNYQNDFGVRYVRNNTGSDLTRHSVLKVDGVEVTPTDNLVAWQNGQVVDGATPTADAPFCIIQRSIKDGDSGPAVFVGASAVKVNVTNANDNFASAGTTTANLESGTSGARILWKEAGTGVKHALVSIGSGEAIDGLPVAFARVEIPEAARSGGATTGESITTGVLTTDENAFDDNAGIVLKKTGYYHGLVSGELTYRLYADVVYQDRIIHTGNPFQWLYQHGTIERRIANPPPQMNFVDYVNVHYWKTDPVDGFVLPTISVESFNNTNATIIASDNDANNPSTALTELAARITFFGRSGIEWSMTGSTETIALKMRTGFNPVETLTTRLENHNFSGRNNIQADDLNSDQGPPGVLNPEQQIIVRQPVAFQKSFYSPQNQAFSFQMDLSSLINVSTGGGTTALVGSIVSFTGNTTVYWLGSSAT